MFKEMHIERFRGISDLHIKDLQQFNLFVGKNSCGKSSILESFFIMTAPTNMSLYSTINNFRKIDPGDYFWNLIFQNLDHNSTIKLSSIIKYPPETRKLEIIANTDFIPYNSKDGKKSTDTGDYSTGILPLPEGIKIAYTCFDNRTAESKTTSGAIRFIGEELAFQKSENYIEPLKGIILNPFEFYQDMSIRFGEFVASKNETKIIVDALINFDPSVKNVVMGPGGKIFIDIGLDRMIPVNLLGAGIVRCLIILIDILSVRGGVLYIDEVENGLHYSTLVKLWKTILSTAKKYNVQLIATTHSYECVSAFSSCFSDNAEFNEEKRLYRIEKENEKTDVVDFDYEAMKTALESNWEIR